MDAIQSHNLTLALQLAKQGVFVFPCVGKGERRKTPCPGVAWRSMSSTDARVITAWWQRWPDAVPAIDMGRSNAIAIDCDRKQSDGRAWLKELLGDEGDLASVPGANTPSGGRHFIFRNPQELGNSRGGLPPKTTADIDIRGKGGYIIAPGARFADGGHYEPIGELTDICDMPAALLAVLTASSPPLPPPQARAVGDEGMSATATYVPGRPITDRQREAYGLSAMEGAAEELAAAAVGERNDLANNKGYHLGRLAGAGYMTQGEAYSALERAGFALGLHRKDKLFGPKGTLWRAIEAGMADPYDPLAGREEPGVVIDLVTRAPRAGFFNFARVQPAPLIAATPFILGDPSLIPKRAWVYGTHLIRKFGSATIAHGGVGKSSLLIAEALAMATGRPLLGIAPREKYRVWLWNGEDPMEEIRRRIAAACLFFDITPAEIEGWLFVDSGRDCEIVIATETRSGNVTIAKPVVEALEKTIHDNKIDVVMIDPFISSHRVSENDNIAIDAVAKQWTRLADVTNCAIDLAHHSRKTGGNAATVEDGRGASSLLSAVRSARVLNAMTAEEAAKCGIANRRSYVRLTNGKLNLARPPEKDDWFFLRPVHLRNGEPGKNLDFGDEVGVATPWEWPDAMDGVSDEDFDKVARVVRAGTWRYSAQARNWVGYAVAQALAPRFDLTKKPDKAKVLGMLRVWLGIRQLVVVKLPDETRRPREFVQVRVEQSAPEPTPEVSEEGSDPSEEGSDQSDVE